MDRTTLTTYASSSTVATFGGMTANDIAAFGGLAFIALTYVTNLYFKIKADKRVEKDKAAN